MKLCWQDKHAMSTLQQFLSQDKVLLLSGDTVLGLFARCSKAGFESLNTIKKRDKNPYLIIIKSAEHLDRFIDQELSLDILKLIALAWPGPITLIFKARADLAECMKSSQGTIAIRVPDHVGLLTLLEKFDGLFSTSANLSTKPVPTVLEDIDPSIMQYVAAVCTDCSVIFSHIPSTILDCSSGKVVLVRKGSMKESLQHYLDKLLK